MPFEFDFGVENICNAHGRVDGRDSEEETPIGPTKDDRSRQSHLSLLPCPNLLAAGWENRVRNNNQRTNSVRPHPGVIPEITP